MSRLPAPSFALLFLLISSACFAGDLKEKEWSELSDRRLTATGEAAFGVYKKAWRHAETAHFVYHFHDPKASRTVLIHAEATYDWVKTMFGAVEDRTERKSHVFIFDERPVWDSFKERTPEKLPGAEAFTNGEELFVFLEPFYLEPQRVLAHEITHLVLARFVEGVVPLFLNEGFAEHMASKAIAMKADGDEYRLRQFPRIAPEAFIPVEKLASAHTYPESGVEEFYRQSELFTRFLILNHPSEKYYGLLKSTAAGTPLDAAVKKQYGWDPEELSEKYRLYAMTRP